MKLLKKNWCVVRHIDSIVGIEQDAPTFVFYSRVTAVLTAEQNNTMIRHYGAKYTNPYFVVSIGWLTRYRVANQLWIEKYNMQNEWRKPIDPRREAYFVSNDPTIRALRDKFCIGYADGIITLSKFFMYLPVVVI